MLLESKAVISVNVVGEILAAGEGVVDVLCVPIQNPQGVAGVSIPVLITPNL